MTIEEDLAIIRLRDRIVAGPPEQERPSNFNFRLNLIDRISKVESVSRDELELRRLERSGLVDKAKFRKGNSDEYWNELHRATEPNEEWRQQEDTYNIIKDSRARPPPPQQATLYY